MTGVFRARRGSAPATRPALEAGQPDP
jgi:hypothetical protein